MGNDCCCTFACSLPQLLLFPHLICSSFCWTLVSPPPPHFYTPPPNAPPTTPLPSMPYSLSTFTPLQSFIILKSATGQGLLYPGRGLRSHSALKAECVRHRDCIMLCCGPTRALGSVDSRGFYVNVGCRKFLKVLRADTIADMLNFPFVGKKKPTKIQRTKKRC